MVQVAPLHTPEEMRSISDLAHWNEGAVLGLAGLVAIMQATGRYTTGWARLAWPALVLAAGVFLLGYLLLPHHGLDRARDQWAFIFEDSQQRQHVALASSPRSAARPSSCTVWGARGGRSGRSCGPQPWWPPA